MSTTTTSLPARALALVGVVFWCASMLVLWSLQASAGELDPESEVGQRATACGDVPFVYGQVWDDADGDDQLLEDAGVGGVTVTLLLEGEDPVVTDAAGFWGVCTNSDEEVLLQDSNITVELPEGWEFVAPGVGAEDQDSDVGIDGVSATFSVLLEYEGPSQFEAAPPLIRIDAGIRMIVADPPPLLECPEWDAASVAADPDGDWDGDGTFNEEDDDPCNPPEVTVDPCAVFSEETVAAEPDGDWDDDGLVNGVDPTPCEAGVGNPCPEVLPIHVEEEPASDWDGDGLLNVDDAEPCIEFVPGPTGACPVWNAELVAADPDGDWDGDGAANGVDLDPCNDEIIEGLDDGPDEATPDDEVDPVDDGDDTSEKAIADDEVTTDNEDDEAPIENEDDGGDPVEETDGDDGPPWLLIVGGLLGIAVVGGGLFTLLGGGGSQDRDDDDDDERRRTRGRIVGGTD